MDEIKEQKKALRQKMFAARHQLAPLRKAKYDQFICDQLLAMILKNNFRVVHAYLPMGQEIDIAPLLQELLKMKIKVICPKTLPARTLENRVLNSLQDIETGIKGTQHPATPNVYDGKYDLIIVPGLAFDQQGYRLGYGAGYYDNFLVSHPQAYQVGIFYPFQKVDAVPREAHDVCLQEILVGEF